MPTDTNDKRIINLGNLRTAIDNIKSTFVKKTGDTITGNLTATTFTEGNQLLSNKYQAKLTFDDTPTLNSTNPVTSNGVYNAIANIDKKSFMVVTDLPTTNIDTNKIYLKYITGSKQDNYEEYVYTTTWVKIGETSLDLSGYLSLTGGTLTGALIGTTISANSFTEGGVALSTKYQTALTFDTTPTLNSTNPVTSNGIKAAINAVANDVSTLSGIINAADTGLLARVTAIENALNEINTALADS